MIKKRRENRRKKSNRKVFKCNFKLKIEEFLKGVINGPLVEMLRFYTK